MQLDLLAEPYPKAAQWRDANPEAYRQIVAWAEVDHKAGRTCSMQLYIELLRRPEFRPDSFMASDDTYVVNHNLRSEIERLVMSENPHLVFRIRKSSLDAQGTHATPKVERRHRSSGTDAPNGSGGGD